MTPQPDIQLSFAGFRLDVRGQRLWQGERVIALRPRTWQLLMHLVGRPGELVSTDALHDLLWPGVAVTPKALTNLIVELRRSLGDEEQPPRLIETVHRRGYRFNVEVHRLAVPPVVQRPLVPEPGAVLAASAAPFVGRQAALAPMLRRLQLAAGGARQVVMLSGEAGIGKTALAEHVATIAQGSGAWRVARGPCVEQGSEREAFAPVLELLAELCRGPQADRVLALLPRYAPCWWLQMPWLHQGDSAAQLRQELGGSGAGRMLREGRALFEALCEHTPLLLLVEDIHWADGATLDLLAHLASGHAPARLMLLLTSRTPDMANGLAPSGAGMALARCLSMPERGLDLALPPLGEADVLLWLQARLGHHAAWPASLQSLLMQQCDGNPLFLAVIFDHLQDVGGLRLESGAWALDEARVREALAHELPRRLAAMIGERFARLDAGTRQLLEVASAVGVQVPVPLLAAASGQPELEVERQCAALARHTLWLQPAPPRRWADGREASVFAFSHELYRRVLYDEMPAGLRRALHERTARALEAAYRERLHEVAAEVAVAYVAAELPADAVRVLQVAAGVAAQRFAYAEAAQTLQAAREQLALLPDTPQRARDAVYVNLTLASLTLTGLGFSHPQVQACYQAALTAAERADTTLERVRASTGACMGDVLAGRFAAALRRGQEAVELAHAHHPDLEAMACTYAGLAATGCAELPTALHLFERAMTLTPAPGLPLFIDILTMAAFQRGRVLCLMGRLDAGTEAVAEAERRVRAAGVAFDRIQTLQQVADCWRLLGRREEAVALFDEVLELAERHALSFFCNFARVMRWGLARPLADVPAELETWMASLDHVADCWRALSLRLFVADALCARGRLAEAEHHLEQAWPLLDGCSMFKSSALCSRATWLAASGAAPDAVEPVWRQAQQVARQQGAGLLEQQATEARRRWLQGLEQQGRGCSARA